MIGESTHTTLEERMVPGLLFSSECVPQQSVTEIVKWPLRLTFNYIQPIHTALQMKNNTRRTSAINLDKTKNSHDSCYKRRKTIIRHCHKFLYCHISKGKWDSKKDTGKFMNHVLHILWYVKRHCQTEAMLNCKKNQAHIIALAIV